MTPQHIGRYELHGKIGQGGMASIYQGYDPRFKRTVAIKLMPSALMADETFLARFEQEAQTIAALEHSAIVPVYDFGEHEGQPYIIMRYMAGGTLSEVIAQQGALPLDETAHIIERVAAALDWAHLRGVIHRDVKPSNILFDEAGDVYLGDFGIVKLTEATAQLTGSGIVGTPAYMAPEMMNQGGVTHLIDVYALGITLYEMLTGRLPFKADTPMGILMAHVASPVPDARTVRPDLPGDLQYVIDRSMSKDPAERYQKARILAADVSQAVRAAVPGALVDKADSLAPAPASTSPEPVLTDLFPEDWQATRVAGDPLDAATVPGPLPTGSRPVGRRGMPGWVWAVGGLTVGAVLVGILAMSGILGWQGRPEPTPAGESAAVVDLLTPLPSQTPDLSQIPEPTLMPVPTSIPAPTIDPAIIDSCVASELPFYACVGVPTNSAWEPYIEVINGVEMALVPAGCFQMGSDEGNSNEQPVHRVCFERPFWIDVYEVTNEQFGSTGCDEVSSEPDQPRNCVDWPEAYDYCESRGARLPTEAEWEYAARGPDNLTYPWGNEFIGEYAVIWDNSGDHTWAVGSIPGGVSWAGVYDLSGNVWEWVNDWYDADYYGTLANGVVDPPGPGVGSFRVMRGGAWSGLGSSVRAAYRLLGGRNNDTGFRCAMSPQP